MDFISELVLGYTDLDLTARLAADGITNYHILRYRDDFRIFVNNPREGEVILKALTEILIDLGLKLNTSKTIFTSQVVSSSLKADKRAWFRSRQGDRNLQKHLLVIHAHGADFPNSGTLTVALTRFHQRLSKAKDIQNPKVLISIVVDIAYSSPKVFPVCAAIISNLLTVLADAAERIAVIKKIYAKLSQLPNIGHMEIWLQRISHVYAPRLAYSEKLCKLVRGKPVELWNDNWITSTNLKKALDPKTIVNKSQLKALKAIVKPKEIAVFAVDRY